MRSWKPYAAAFFLTLTIALLWICSAAGPTPQTADARLFGPEARARREARREARWERIQGYHRQHDVQPTPQPVPVPTPTPPTPVVIVPPAPINPPKPASPDPILPTAAGHLYLIEVVPSLMTVDSNAVPVLFSPAVLAALAAHGNHRQVYDPQTAPPSIKDAVARAVADGLPRGILLDTTLTADKWIVGSIDLTSEAEILGHLKAYQGGTAVLLAPPLQSCPVGCNCY